MNYQIRRIDKLIVRLKSRTRADGEAMPGYRQNVAQLRAEIDMLTNADAVVEKTNGKEA